MVHGVVVQELSRNDLLDDLLLDFLAELLGGDVLGVLSRDNNSVNALGDDGTVVVLILDGDLGLGVGSEPWQRAVTTSSRHGGVKLVGEQQSQGEELRGLVGGIAEHNTLVTGAELLKGLLIVQTLGDIGRLLLNGNQKVESLVVEPLGRVVVTDILDGIANDLLVIELGLGGDFTEDHDHTGLGSGLTSDLGQRVLSQASIEDSIGDLISDLVGVTLTDGLGGEEEAALVVVGAVCSVDAVGGHYDWCDLSGGRKRRED